MRKINSPSITNLISHNDIRGNFIELLRLDSLPNSKFGQLSITSILPSHEKGNHYHKIRWEWFCVMTGKIEVEIIDCKTSERKKLTLSSKNPQMLCIPPYWHHILHNKSTKEAYIIIYSSIPFLKATPDVYEWNT